MEDRRELEQQQPLPGGNRRKKIKLQMRRRSVGEIVIEHVNLVTHFKLLCQFCAGSFSFWCLVAAFALAEPVLCSQYTYIGSVNHLLQIALLAISSILFIVQLVGVATREWDKIIMIQSMSSFSSNPAANSLLPAQNEFSFMKLFLFFTAEGEYLLEFLCLMGGWAYIFVWPGIAALRCFRVFRLLWFYEVDVFRKTIHSVLSPIIGEEYVTRGFKVLKFSIRSLTALGNELFRLTNETRGALLLILIFSYTAFVLAIALWIETKNNNEHCLFVGQCTYTLMRLTFFDGDGFDFAYFLTGNHRIMFCVVMMYVCLTSFGILNGLVGIFGTVFTRASADAFSDDNYYERTLRGGGSYRQQQSSADEADDVDRNCNDNSDSDSDNEQLDDFPAAIDDCSQQITGDAAVAGEGSVSSLDHGASSTPGKSAATAVAASVAATAEGGNLRGSQPNSNSNSSCALTPRGELHIPRKVGESNMQMQSQVDDHSSNRQPLVQSAAAALNSSSSDALRLELATGAKSSFVRKQLMRSGTAGAASPSFIPFSRLDDNDNDYYHHHRGNMETSPQISANHTPRNHFRKENSSSKIYPTGRSVQQQQHQHHRTPHWADQGLFAARNLGGSIRSNATSGTALRTGNALGAKDLQTLAAKVAAMQKKLDQQSETIAAFNQRSELQHEIILSLHSNVQQLISQQQQQHQLHQPQQGKS